MQNSFHLLEKSKQNKQILKSFKFVRKEMKIPEFTWDILFFVMVHNFPLVGPI